MTRVLDVCERDDQSDNLISTASFTVSILSAVSHQNYVTVKTWMIDDILTKAQQPTVFAVTVLK